MFVLGTFIVGLGAGVCLPHAWARGSGRVAAGSAEPACTSGPADEDVKEAALLVFGPDAVSNVDRSAWAHATRLLEESLASIPTCIGQVRACESGVLAVDFAIIEGELDVVDHAYELIDRCRCAGLDVSCGIVRVPSPRGVDAYDAAMVALAHAQEQGGGRAMCWHYPMMPPQPHPETARPASLDPKLATVVALAEAIDLRDSDTSQHSRMVGWYTELMGRALGLPTERVEQLRVGGLLHDIGKIGVPDSILHKPAKLTDEEFATMQEHPVIGARVLASIDADDIRSWVESHHERWDGRGYPHGLKGERIPLEARILAVADSYEAMTSDRVYRAAPGPEFAREELRRCSGSQFDPEVVDAFLSVLDQVDPLPAPITPLRDEPPKDDPFLQQAA